MSLLKKIMGSKTHAAAAKRSLEWLDTPEGTRKFREMEAKLMKEQEKKNDEIQRTLTISQEKLHRPFDI